MHTYIWHSACIYIYIYIYIVIIRPHLEYASAIWNPYLLRDQQIFESIQKSGWRVCLKLSYPAMHRTLSIPTLAGWKQQLHQCTFLSYMNQFSIAPIANITHRVPPITSRHIHDLFFACTKCFFPIHRTILPDTVVHSNSLVMFKHSL